MVPNGYLTIPEAIKQCEDIASWQRHLDPTKGSPFLGRNENKPPKLILERALASGELQAAIIRRSDGELIAMPAASWRRGHSRPSGAPWERPSGITILVPVKPFTEAAVGSDVPAMTDTAGMPDCWGTPVIAEHDLSRWWGDANPPPAPSCRPEKWPAARSSSTSLEAAITWMRENGTGNRKADEPDCKAALGCTRDVARKAAKEVFGPARMGRPRK
jgi:hypothetical protein